MNGIVYAIRDLSTKEIIYVGSTTNLLMRKAAHKRDCFTKQKELLIYNYIRERTDREHFDECFTFEELYSGEFETREELRMKEEEFITEKVPCCNKNKAFQSDEELKEYHREYMREYNKKENWREYMREYNQAYNKTDNRREYMREYMREYQKTEKQRKYQREYLREYRRRKKLAQESKTLY